MTHSAAMDRDASDRATIASNAATTSSFCSRRTFLVRASGVLSFFTAFPFSRRFGTRAEAQWTRSIPQQIAIHRSAENNECTTGYLSVDGRMVCYTLELPDNANRRNVSRIPAGSYRAHLRYDHEDAWRVELENVRGRTNVEIHVGNWPFDTEGCILVGAGVDPQGCRLRDSERAYEQLRTALYGDSDPEDVAEVFDLTVEISGP